MCRIKLPVIHAFVVLSMILWCVDSQQFSPDGIDLHPLLSFFLFEFIFLCVMYVVRLFEIGASSLSSRATVDLCDEWRLGLDQECGNTCRCVFSPHTSPLTGMVCVQYGLRGLFCERERERETGEERRVRSML